MLQTSAFLCSSDFLSVSSDYGLGLLDTGLKAPKQ